MKYKVNDLFDAYNFFEAHRQYFSFLRKDITDMKDGHQFIFSLDSYDLNSILFEKNTFINNPNEHFETMRAYWLQFISDIQGDSSKILTIEPLAIFETIYHIWRSSDRLKNDPSFDKIRSIDIEGEIKGILENMEKMEQEYKDGNIPWSNLSETIKRALLVIKRAKLIRFKDNEKDAVGLVKLLQLLESNKIRVLDDVLNEHDIIVPKNVYEKIHRNNMNFERGLKFLNDERNHTKQSVMFNSLDMLRISAAFNIKELIGKRDINSFMVSNGYKTLNAWSKASNIKDLNSPFRPSQAACYFARGMKLHGSLKEFYEDAEEAMYASRRIARTIAKIPKIDSLMRSSNRDKSLKNALVEVDDKFNIELFNYQSTYTERYHPDKKINFNSVSPKVHISELYSLMNLSETKKERERVSNQIQESTIRIIRNNKLLDFESMPLYGPISDESIKLNRWLNE